MLINRLILEIDDQSMTENFVTFNFIDFHRLSSIFIDYHRLPSIFINRFLFGLIQYWCYYINSVALKSDQYLIYSFPWYTIMSVMQQKQRYTLISAFKGQRGETSSACRWPNCPRWFVTLNAFPRSPRFFLATNSSPTSMVKSQAW